MKRPIGPQIAENVTIDQRGILIDGMRLPYQIGPGPLKIVVNDPADGGMSYVHIALWTETVNVSPNVTVEADGDVILVDYPRYQEETL